MGRIATPQSAAGSGVSGYEGLPCNFLSDTRRFGCAASAPWMRLGDAVATRRTTRWPPGGAVCGRKRAVVQSPTPRVAPQTNAILCSIEGIFRIKSKCTRKLRHFDFW